MSGLPMSGSLLVWLGLVIFFTWNMKFLSYLLIFVVLSVMVILLETRFMTLKNISGFWMFMLSEVIMFMSLMYCCLSFLDESNMRLSKYAEMPFLGTFFLVGSSMSVMGYEVLKGVNLQGSKVFLFFSMLLGLCFVLLQCYEFIECGVSMWGGTYYSCCYALVGLHFSHVLMGIILLMIVLLKLISKDNHYFSTLVVWYWHFVDYIWLLVYFVVYLC